MFKATPILNYVISDLSKRAYDGDSERFEMDQSILDKILITLTLKNKNNPVLLLPKSQLREIIINSFIHFLNENLESNPNAYHKRIVQIDFEKLAEHGKTNSKLDSLLNAFYKEVEKTNGIIFIFENCDFLLNLNESERTKAYGNFFKKLISSKTNPFIITETEDRFNGFLKKNNSFSSYFTPLLIKPLSNEDILPIIQQLVKRYEKHHKVSYSIESIQSCIKLSSIFRKDHPPLDGSLKTIDEIAGKKRISINNYKPEHILKIKEKIDALTEEKKHFVKHQYYERAIELLKPITDLKNKYDKHLKEWNEQHEVIQSYPIDEEDIYSYFSELSGKSKEELTTLNENSKSVDLSSVIRMKGYLSIEEFKTHLKNKVGLGKIEVVIDKVVSVINESNYNDKSLENELVLIHSRKSSLNLKSRMGIISFDDRSIEDIKINKALLELIDKL